MPLLNSVMSWFMKKRIHQIDLFIKYPNEVQEEWFRKLIQQGRYTEIGEKYGFDEIQTPAQFRERMPIHDYNDLKPYIDRMRKGEEDVLWPTEVKWFAKSSGTTGSKSKFIPVSYEALEECHFKGGKDLLSIYCSNNPDTEIFNGRGLGLGGTHDYQDGKPGPFHGDVSAVIMQNLPFWAEFIRTPSLSVALMDEWEEKIEKMAEITIKERVTSMSGVPSWALVLLRRILDITGKNNIGEVWPTLELFNHGGVNFAPYREQFLKILPEDIVYMQAYNASEGFFGIQDRNKADDMLLMLDYGIYYEFLPIQDLGDPFARTLTLDEVETGKQYALIISTNAGLWRYMIGDTVMFTSLDPFRIQVTGRTKSFINAFGEELIVDNAEKAITIACEKTSAIISEYTAGPVFFNGNTNGAHEWLIEFEKEPDNLETFTEELDRALQSLNSDYEAKRYRNMILAMPKVKVLPKNTFYKWLKERGKLGGQNKIPRLSNDRKFIEEILSFV